MIGIEIVKDKKSKAFAPELVDEIVSKTWKNGVLMITCGKSTLRIVPPLTITRALIDEALPVIERAIGETNRKKSR